MTKLIKWIEKKAKEQFTDNSGVRPEFKFSRNIYFLNSPAGLIQFKPKNEKELVAFRDKYVNNFAELSRAHSINDQTAEFYALYAAIRKEYKVRYTANLVTRLKGFGCNLTQYI